MDLTAAQRWSPGPTSPRVRGGVVDVWRADLDAAPDGVAELLCAEERARARRIVPDRPRTIWPRSRGMLRALLARYLDEDPRGLRFERGPLGKPALRPPAGRKPDLRFNLSHSGAHALVAVTAGREVGVDIQCVARRGARRKHELAIAARLFGPEQARRLGELGPDARTRQFLRAWSAHEAALKCAGAGLAGASGPARRDPQSGLWTAALDVGARAAASVATEGREQHELRCFQWLG